MVAFSFPTSHIVGTLEWNGSWNAETGPLLATGIVEVPDGVDVALRVEPVEGALPTGEGAWRTVRGPGSVDLSFLAALPPAGIRSLSLYSVRAETISFLAQLAPGLRRLHLCWTDLTDEALPAIAGCSNLTYLQSFGNRFTDSGVQQLRMLKNLESLYLEEETLSERALAFATDLPRLSVLGVQDMRIPDPDLRSLQSQLPRVRVSR